MKKIINYSGIAGLVLISALFFLSVSCNKDTIEDNPKADSSSQLIKVSGEDANAATKTTLAGLVTSWVATTDKVGIYSPQARTETGSSGSEIVNAQFTAASSGVSSNFTGTMFWGTASTSHTFFAYYPWASGTAASTVVPVSLPSAQTQSAAGSNAHIGALDFMVATPVTVTSPDNTDAVANEVNLRYNHVFTVLEFQIKGTGQLKAVKLSGNSTLAFSGGTINITQATPATGVAYTIAGQTGTTTQAVVTLTAPAALSTSTATSVYMVINPGTQTGNCLIGISTDGTTWKYISKTALAGGFLRGNKYVVTVNADDATLENVVVGGAGMIWMDRNLGATRVATASNDYLAYGSLYQWGRLSDGHQAITWTSSAAGTPDQTTTATLSTTDTPVNALFITNSSTPYDWRNPQKDDLWQVSTGTNNPCPSGFRIPTEAELTTEIATWSAQTSVGAYASPLKFTIAGRRSYSDGSLASVGTFGRYWSSTVDGSYSRNLYFTSSNAYMFSSTRAYGFSVRCIKN